MISQEEKSKKVLLAEKRLAQARAELLNAKREERKALENTCFSYCLLSHKEHKGLCCSVEVFKYSSLIIETVFASIKKTDTYIESI